MRSKAEVRLGKGSFRASVSVKEPYPALFISNRHERMCYYGQPRWTPAELVNSLLQLAVQKGIANCGSVGAILTHE